MNKILFFAAFIAILGSSCTAVSGNVFSKKTAHEKYGEKHEDSPKGKAWLDASKKALEHPYIVQLPYSHRGFFGGDKSRALGLQFTAKRGERLQFRLNDKDFADATIYADLFRIDGTGQFHEFSANKTDSIFDFVADHSATYILRLQPELGQSTQYDFSIEVGPSLGYPVAGNKAKAGSFWGAPRDGGKRSHEGVDIFAKKGTPVIASGDGYITAVRDEGIGGKTVWLRLSGKNISLYYAHLDKQLVREGQSVLKGDTLGTVGNTGNAKHTPAHLHFGIYSFGGPVDPYPYVDPIIRKAPGITSKDIAGSLQVSKTIRAANGTMLQPNTVLTPMALNSKGYIVQLPDGSTLQTNSATVKFIKHSPNVQNKS